MKKLVIFGTGDIAELAAYYFENDSEYQVVAFTADPEFVESNEFFGKPLVSFDRIQDLFPPSNHFLFVALSYAKLKLVRKTKYLEGKQKSYRYASFISSNATILNSNQIGENCFILEDNTLQPKSVIGNNVTIWSGNHIGHHSRIGDHTFISSHVVISGGVLVGEQCFLGVNATVRDHIQIGNRTVVGAGALIMKSTPEESVYVPVATEVHKLKSNQLRSI